ncbi:MAG: LacI family DNA-binding transcriptional regulator, partial [Anaerolineales bacterium]|nr:LacI family DNA-binding transcriptional regulator [Anaerolineales bacterium]
MTAISKAMSSKVTLKQISEIADVSIATVSRVINGYVGVSSEIRERVLHVIDETGYQPNPAARSLAGRKSPIIGLIIPQPTSNLFIDPYLSH